MSNIIPHLDPERRAVEQAQLRLDAEQGAALLDALAAKWWEQGYNAALLGLNPTESTFWTTDHHRGYLSALSAIPNRSIHKELARS